MSYVGLQDFYDNAAAGTLPAVSYIIGPAELSEHQPYQPKDGAWLQQQVVNAVVNGKGYNKTALIVSYDETGGWGDHVVPFHSPEGTAGEWVQDPYGKEGYVYTGPGFRVPFYIVSPWTRGGNVYTENTDHNSQILFLEKWLAAKGHNIQSKEMSPWRRANMGDLTKAFDFSNPDYSIPTMPVPETPSHNAAQDSYDGYSLCEAKYNVTRPPVPYGQQNEATALATETGFKQVRGQLTEGRYLVFEMNGYALARTPKKTLTATTATSAHDAKEQRWVVHQSAQGSNEFKLASAVDGKVAKTFVINDLGDGQGYSVQDNGRYLSIDHNGAVAMVGSEAGFRVWSVSYDS